MAQRRSAVRLRHGLITGADRKWHSARQARAVDPIADVSCFALRLSVQRVSVEDMPARE